MDPKFYAQLVNDKAIEVVRALTLNRVELGAKIDGDQSANFTVNVLRASLALTIQLMAEELKGQYDKSDENAPESIAKIKERLSGVISESIAEIVGPGWTTVRHVIEGDDEEPQEPKETDR